MKLKATLFDGAKHTDTVTAISWTDSENLFSASDDHLLMKWNFLSNEACKVSKLPEDFFPTALHWFPKTQHHSSKKHSSDVLLAASADGKFHFLNKSGRFDRSIEAHQGAVLVALWSHDGAGILTGGEDGQVKIWSRSGMLRSTVVSTDVPVYAAAWGPDSNQILIAQSSSLFLKPLAPNSKTNRWRAHEGLILTVSWNQSNNLIVSGGEDSRYKVWDHLGHLLYSSSSNGHAVSSVAWAPGGDLFAVASFHSLRLCDRVGWSHSLEKVPTGTIYDLAWSPDGTLLAGACGNGALLFAHVIDRRLEWKNIEITLVSRESISVRNVMDETEDILELGSRVAKMALGFNQLVVTTVSQCHIYSITNWNTPIIIPLKDGSASIISLSYRIFSLVEGSNINIYGYDGKFQTSPKLPGWHMNTLEEGCLSLSPDLLAIVDQTDEKALRVFDLSGSRQIVELPILNHSQGVIQVAINQTGILAERRVAFLDRNKDCYLWAPRSRTSPRPIKLMSMLQAIAWSSDSAILVGVRDAVLTFWCCPNAISMDKHLLRRTILSKDLSELGKSLSLVNFVGNHVAMRRLDGSNVSQSIPSYFAILLDFADAGKWEDASKLCRFINEEILWACLACLACSGEDLETAEEAYAAINELDKVIFIQNTKALPDSYSKSANFALLSGNISEAENILLLNGNLLGAIKVLVDSHNWIRALELAVKHRAHVDTVLYKRKLYLMSIGKEESNEKFLKYGSEVSLDIEAMKIKLSQE